MSTTIGIAVTAARAVSMMSSYFGLIETTASDVSKLKHHYLKNGQDYLKRALECTKIIQEKGDHKQQEVNDENIRVYLTNALNEFISAKNVEENENKIDALVGVCLCLYLIGDKDGAMKMKKELESVELSRSERVKARLKNMADLLIPLWRWGDVVVDPAPVLQHDIFRSRKLEQKKDDAVKMIDNYTKKE